MFHTPESAVRAWVEPKTRPHRRMKSRWKSGWRTEKFGDRVLVFDCETTTDYTQALLSGFFQLRVNGELEDEGLVVADDLGPADLATAHAWARAERLLVFTRTEFVTVIFYPAVYELGALCVGFNLPFDLTRIAIHAGCGRGRHSRAFNVKLTENPFLPRLRIESISSRAAFIEFAPCKRKFKGFFKGRFLDCKALVSALTGESHSLRSACELFETDVRKSGLDEYGVVSPESLKYGRNDVAATWSLYVKLREEYQRYGFATFENEFEASEGTPMTQLYSAAGVGKATLTEMGIKPLLEKQLDFPRKVLGAAMASYFGGRAEVRVRKVGVPIRLVDFTAMYPTVFILKDLQRLLLAKRIEAKPATRAVRELLDRITFNDLFDPNMWPQLNCLVRLRPEEDVLPLRCRIRRSGSLQIALAYVTSEVDHCYTLADLVAAKLLGGKVPKVHSAIKFSAIGRQSGLRAIDFRGQVRIDPCEQIFKRIVEERQRAKAAPSDDLEAQRLATGLKILANSASYGIFAEINVTPSNPAKPKSGMVYGLETFESPDMHDERPGKFSNPIIAMLVTGGARLLLAMLETAVTEAGGTYAFCDTDSLAIVSGADCPPELPCISREAVLAIIDRFNALNPYDRNLVPNILKLEREDVPCFAVSAKRYVLNTRTETGIDIVDPSEHGLGAFIEDPKAGADGRLPRRIWEFILAREFGLPYDTHALQVPARRRFPIQKPEVLKRFAKFNKGKPYRDQVKPFNFLQTVTVAIEMGEPVQPVAPFEQSLVKSRRLPWIDLNTGEPVELDWDGVGYAGTVPVQRLDELAAHHARHAEEKAADNDSKPAGEKTRGVLGRLHIMTGPPIYVGKEIDRIDEDEGLNLAGAEPAIYKSAAAIPEYERALDRLKPLPNRKVARQLGISERSWHRIKSRRVTPSKKRCLSIIRIALNVRESTLIA